MMMSLVLLPGDVGDDGDGGGVEILVVLGIRECLGCRVGHQLV